MNWEDGQVKTKTGSCAGNATISLSPGAGRKWLVIYGWIKIVCDATVANRNTILQITTSGGTDLTYVATSPNVTASNSYTWRLIPISGYVTVTIQPGIFTNNVMVVNGTDKLYITTAAGVAGDAVTCSITVIELPA